MSSTYARLEQGLKIGAKETHPRQTETCNIWSATYNSEVIDEYLLKERASVFSPGYLEGIVGGGAGGRSCLQYIETTDIITLFSLYFCFI